MGTSVSVTKGSTVAEWLQIFQGIFIGLDIKGVNISKCVKDAEDVPKAFLAAFTDFQNRVIFGGLKKLGTALGLIVNSINDCGLEKAFIGRIETFAKISSAAQVQVRIFSSIQLKKNICVYINFFYMLFFECLKLPLTKKSIKINLEDEGKKLS